MLWKRLFKLKVQQILSTQYEKQHPHFGSTIEKKNYDIYLKDYSFFFQEMIKKT